MSHNTSSLQNLAAGVSTAVLAALAGSVPGAAADWPAGAAAPPAAVVGLPVLAEPTVEPRKAITGFARDVLRAVHDAAPVQALSGVVRSYVAEPELVRSIVAQHWRRLSPNDQQEAIGLFHDCLVAEYADRLAEWAAGLVVTGARVTEDGALVTTEIRSSSAPRPMTLVWRLTRLPGDFLRISDLVLAGISMVGETRQQMAAVVQRNGDDPQAILAVLRQRGCRRSDHNTPAKEP
jgi:ABC-type transporter MlaC component